MQITGSGLVFLVQVIAFILAIMSLFTTVLLRANAEERSKGIIVQWSVFSVIVIVLLYYSNALMIDLGYYPQISEAIVVLAILVLGGFLAIYDANE